MRCVRVFAITALFGALALSPAYAGAEASATFYGDVLPIL